MTLDEATEARVYDKLRAFDGLAVAGHEPVDASIASVLSEGEVLADDGSQYASIQDAVDASDNWSFIGPGTYYENVVIDKDDFTLQGAGHDTLIDGGTVGFGVIIAASNTYLSNISVKTSGNDATRNAVGTKSGAGSGTIDNVRVIDSDAHGIHIENGSDWVVNSCVVESTNTNYTGIRLQPADRTIVSSCQIKSGVDKSMDTRGDDIIVANCTMIGGGDDAIAIQGNDGLFGGCRIHNKGSIGIEIQSGATDNIIFNNRISGSGTSDLTDNGTGTVTDSNLTGSAN